MDIVCAPPRFQLVVARDHRCCLSTTSRGLVGRSMCKDSSFPLSAGIIEVQTFELPHEPVYHPINLTKLIGRGCGVFRAAVFDAKTECPRYRFAVMGKELHLAMQYSKRHVISDANWYVESHCLP